MSPRTSLRSSLGALPRPAWFLFLGAFINKFGGFVVPFLTLYLTGRGCSHAQAAIAVGAYGAGNLVACVVGGHLADHFGRRRTIVLSMFSGAASMLLLSQAHAYGLILALAFLTGLTGEMYRPASSALLADLIAAGESRVTAFSAYRTAFNAGWAFGPATAGFLARQGFGWLFIGDAATSVCFGLVAFLALPRGGHPAPTGAGLLEMAGILRDDRRIRRMLLGAFGIGLIFTQYTTTFGLAVTRAGLSPADYGLLISLNGAMIVFFELPLTTFTRRLPVRPTIAAGYVLASLGFALNAFARSKLGFLACVGLFSLGEMVSMPVSSAYVSELAGAGKRGRYTGLYGLTWASSLILGPSLGMALLAWNGSAWWFGVAAIGLAAAVIV